MMHAGGCTGLHGLVRTDTSGIGGSAVGQCRDGFSETFELWNISNGLLRLRRRLEETHTTCRDSFENAGNLGRC